MTAAWAIYFDISESGRADVAGSLGRLRRLAGARALRTDESRLWVAGPSLDDELLVLLRGLSCEDRFRVDADGTLTRFNERTPSGVVPDGEWIPVAELVELELPIAGVSLARIPRVPVTLVRSSEPVEPQFLLVSGEAALSWAASASQVRLDRLSFAASDDGRFLFRGTPLPPLPGVSLVDRELVLVPAGWTWSPATDANSLRSAIEAESGDLILLNHDGEFEKISESEFVAASRAAIRVSAGE
jgi:hypothetical protein